MDQIQELRGSCRSGLRSFFDHYKLAPNSVLDQQRFRNTLDTIVDEELNLFVFHEIGEAKEELFGTSTLKTIVMYFPHSVIELVARSVKDLLADTHKDGLLSYCIKEKRRSSLSLYLGLLDGVRKELFPEILDAWSVFDKTDDWELIEEARSSGRKRMRGIAREFKEIVNGIVQHPIEAVEAEIHGKIIAPLGFDVPKTV